MFKTTKKNLGSRSEASVFVIALKIRLKNEGKI
jgi:hypothetical protein